MVTATNRKEMYRRVTGDSLIGLKVGDVERVKKDGKLIVSQVMIATETSTLDDLKRNLESLDSDIDHRTKKREEIKTRIALLEK